MYQGEVIFDYYPETTEKIRVLKKLKGDNQLLFAIREYEKENIEGELRYIIDDAIVTSSGPEITQLFFGFSNNFMWFEPRNDEEIGVCINQQIDSYFGCILEDGLVLEDAKFAFEYFELLTVKDDPEAALYICAKDSKKVEDFLMGLEGYTRVDVKEDSRVWLADDSEYFDIWEINEKIK